MSDSNQKRVFEIGKAYKTQDGNDVEIQSELHYGSPYYCVQGDDGIWRYARESDCGRVTGSNFDMSDDKNLVVPTK